ncbi:MAG TPA: DUF4082 domain-containing protein, partial [Candidatus Methylomirabilis sp.]|nr:DUF4082 domain-containing protein [Candidatus Methylomirabilis sp.]
MQYLDNSIPQSLTCCTPIEYPVEVALGAADFVSEDVQDVNSDFGMCPECAIQAYYRLLNTGFRPGLAAGTDYPCNGGEALGSLLTYVQVADGQMTYRNWIEGIAKGRTVVSRNGHNEFLAVTVNGTATPGDEIQLTGGGSVQVTIQWTATQNLTGTVELVQNGVVVASQPASVTPSVPATMTTSVNFAKSGWLAARRMDGNGHQVHTAAVFVTVNQAPVRVSVEDAQFYVQWMDTLLTNTSPGGIWNSYFPTNLAAAQARYQAAKAVYQQIAVEAMVVAKTPASGATGVAVGTTVTATFSKALDPTTVSSSTVFLQGPGGSSIPATVSYDSSSFVATLTPSSALANSTTYTATVKGGPSGVKDPTGTALAADVTWTFTTASGSSCPCAIWPATATPAVAAATVDPSAIEMGVKFQASVSGAITGMRFYKGATNTGTHVGNLWSGTGTLLASVPFSTETASGWQQATFATPVAITANTTYVVSYHTSGGNYAYTYD